MCCYIFLCVVCNVFTDALTPSACRLSLSACTASNNTCSLTITCKITLALSIAIVLQLPQLIESSAQITRHERVDLIFIRCVGSPDNPTHSTKLRMQYEQFILALVEIAQVAVPNVSEPVDACLQLIVNSVLTNARRIEKFESRLTGLLLSSSIHLLLSYSLLLSSSLFLADWLTDWLNDTAAETH